MTDDDLLARASTDEAETAELDFKAAFDPRSTGEWCELVKDIVAFGNSGGGCIAFGVNDDGSVADADQEHVRQLDPATVADKVRKYTNQQAGGFRLRTVRRAGSEIVVLLISGFSLPVVFTATGNYDSGGRQKNAFVQGTVYFRHGAKSEPGSIDDLRAVMEREIDRVRSSWLDGIQKVVTAPVGATISVLPGEVRLSGADEATGVRLVNDESAPAFRAMRTDLLYPHRQKELLARVNALISGVKITGHDVICVRKAHGVDGNLNFFYKPQFSSPQYSEAFAEWMAEDAGELTPAVRARQHSTRTLSWG